MDINVIRSIMTVLMFAAFVGIVWWAYGAARKDSFERAGRSVLEEEDDSTAGRVRPAGPRGA